MVKVSTAEEVMRSGASDGPFGFFIIDCNLRETNPSTLCIDLLELTGERPLIFLGTQVLINDRVGQKLSESNAFNAQIHMPFERNSFLQEFKDKINHALKWAKEEEFEQSLEQISPEDYIPMKIRAFYFFSTFPYDIYLSITQTTYIKIISANKSYSHSTLVTYAKKNVKFLLIKKDDQLKFLEKEISKCIKGLAAIDHNKKDVYLLQLRSITILHQYILALGVSPSVLSLMDICIDSIIKTTKIKFNLADILSEYPYFYEGSASKSLLTAFISVALSKKLDWESETTKKKLVICAILQDLTLPDEAMSKINSANSPKLKEFKQKEVNEFLKHSLSSAAYAHQFSNYPDIGFIIERHHELPNKRGFPNKPANAKITQICTVFNTSQHIAAEIDGEELTNQFLSKVLKPLSRNHNTGFYKEVQNFLRAIVRVNA